MEWVKDHVAYLDKLRYQRADFEIQRQSTVCATTTTTSTGFDLYCDFVVDITVASVAATNISHITCDVYAGRY
jgi:hypothetical protein